MNKIINLEILLENLEKEYEMKKKKIIEEVKVEYEKILEKYRREAEKRGEEEVEKIIEDAKRKADLILRKKVSEAELNAKWILLKEKEEAFHYIINRFLEEVYEQTYSNISKEIFFWHLYRTLKVLNVEKCNIRIVNKTSKLVDKRKLKEKLKADGIKMKISFKNDDNIDEGAIIEALDGKLKVNCSFRELVTKDEDLIKRLLNEKVFERTR